MSNRIKVLHVIDSLGYGGSEHQLALIVGALDKRRYENIVCYLHPPGYLEDRMKMGSDSVLGLGLPRGMRYWPRAVFQLRKLIKSHKVDLVHTSLFEADVTGGIAGRLTGVPVLGTLCNVVGEPESLIDNPNINRMKLTFTTKLWRFALRYFHHHNIAVSDAVKASAIKTFKFPEKRFTVIYRALSDRWTNDDGHSEKAQALRHELGLEDAFPLILNVGRLVPQKGQRYLIEAMPKVLTEFPKARVGIVGEGLLREELDLLCRQLGVEGHVHFLGRRNDVPALVTMSNIFAFPSLFEGCPNALIEALALGKPSVGFDIPPVAEITDSNGHVKLVPIRSSSGLAESIITLARHYKEAESMAAQASKTVRSQFTVQKMAQELEHTYERILAQMGAQAIASDSATH